MSLEPLPRPAPREGPPPVSVVPIPKEGEALVLFLANYDGCITHRMEKHSVGCPGAGMCPPGRHKGQHIWKGFAPAIIWPVTGNRPGLPCCFEITEGLAAQLMDIELRGTVWRVWRGLDEYGHSVGYGLHEELWEEAETPPPHPYKGAATRCLKCHNLVWGVKPPHEGRVYVPLFTDKAPSCVAQGTDSVPFKRMTPEESAELRKKHGLPPLRRPSGSNGQK